ncbi:tRNA(fMet)-specific endonuclease VapC [uncultured archaeon]|nr:tRNA(fMet)-specific endonuclease VapC [uncultured archaeon]
MYLLDTNIFLELLLNQAKADEVDRLLRETPPDTLCVSDFSLGSIGVILFRRKLHGLFLKAVDDLFLSGGLRIVRLDVTDMSKVLASSKKYGLDYDDSYQYSISEKYNLILVSYDGDFDRTSRGRTTPGDILN